MAFDPQSLAEYEAALDIPRMAEAPDLSPELIQAITKAVFMPHNPQPAECLFVFGTVQADWDGLAASVLNGDFDRVVLAGKIGPEFFESGKPISHTMRERLLERGVPEAQVLWEDQSTNTLEDVIFSLDLIGRAAGITFAAKAHHSGRCARTLRRFYPGAILNAHTTVAHYGDVAVKAEDWWKHPVSTGRVYGEYERILTYAARGDISRHV